MVDNVLYHVDEKRVSQAAHILINMKSDLKRELNVDYQKLDGSSKLTLELSQSVKFTRRIRDRADRIRIYLEFYYIIMEKSTLIDSSSLYHGVEGIYNPLQVIRNRKIRKSHKTRELNLVRSPIIAIRDFSDKYKVTPWFVDINEKSSDLTWRTSHWDELKGPDNEYWFKKRKNRYSYNAKSKLLTPDHRESSVSGNEDNNIQLLSDNELLSPRYVKNHEQISGKYCNNRSEKGLTKNLFLKLSRPPSKTQTDAQFSISGSASSGERCLTSSPFVYQTPIETKGLMSAIADVKIESKKPRVIEGDIQDLNQYFNIKSSQDQIGNLSVTGIVLNSSNLNTSVSKQWSKLQTFKATWNLMKHREYILKKRELYTIQKYFYLRNKSVLETKNQIPPAIKILDDYKLELSNAIQTTHNWKSKLLNDYSARVDVLISNSDRILSDINTTLTLRSKVLGETVDKTGLISNMHNGTWRKIVYRLLEIIIVAVLWGIWFLFSFINVTKSLIFIILKIIQWIIW